VRTPFVQTAVVVLASPADVSGPGAAVTLELCGSWEHDPPCPLAAHHTAIDASGDQARVRILFATEPAHESEVRSRIAAALGSGAVDGPDGRTSRWSLVSASPGVVEPAEVEHARRLARV